MTDHDSARSTEGLVDELDLLEQQGSVAQRESGGVVLYRAI